MTELNSEIKPQVITASEQHKSVVGEVLSQAFGATLMAEPGVDVDIVGQGLPELLSGSGLVLIPRVGNRGCLVLMPDVAGITPDWCREPDETQQGILRNLALQLGKTLLPESCAPTDALFWHVDDLTVALQRAGIDAMAACVSITFKSDTSTNVLYLVWPSSRPEGVFGVSSDAANEGSSDAEAASADSVAQSRPQKSAPVFYRDMDEGITLLPPYSKSLLKVKVPVTVTLAATKQPLNRILKLSPGSIIQFNKPCDDTLSLEIGGQRVAIGEAVKVGDKFGFWITAMAMPEERFWVISGSDERLRAK